MWLCPRCKRRIGAAEARCPDCQYVFSPFRAGSWILLLGAVLVVLGALVAFGFGAVAASRGELINASLGWTGSIEQVAIVIALWRAPSLYR